ncbi:MAG: hypothetical protein M3459_05910 [Actinomycetota bacterium]|nr:hypothetical protein [Actinomycetota bacterium]
MTTHTVTNQPPRLADRNLFSTRRRCVPTIATATGTLPPGVDARAIVARHLPPCEGRRGHTARGLVAS